MRSTSPRNRSASPSNEAAAPPQTVHITGALARTAIVSAISGFLYGYDTGIISGALLGIRRDFHIGDKYVQVIAASILLGRCAAR